MFVKVRHISLAILVTALILPQIWFFTSAYAQEEEFPDVDTSIQNSSMFEEANQDQDLQDSEEISTIDEQDSQDDQDEEEDEEEEEEELSEAEKQRLEEEERFERRLRNARQAVVHSLLGQFESLQDDRSVLNEDYESAREKYERAYNKIRTLAGRIEELDDEIRDTKKRLKSLNRQIDEKEEEIENLGDQIQEKEDELEGQKDVVGEYIRLLYTTSDRNTLEVLLTSDTLASAVQETKALERVESVGEDLFRNLESLKVELEDERGDLEKKKERLQELHQELEIEQQDLEDEKETKSYLLEKTQNKEEEYQELMEEAQAEQEQIEDELHDLEAELRDLDAQGELTHLKLKYIDFGNKVGLTDSESGLGWPLADVEKITASFHDPNYPYSFKHTGVDLRASQGTPILAAADCYVLKAKDNGFGFSYIVCAHSATVTTLYGHVSEILVEEGEMINKGEVIGLSGGRPGTRGAGATTTGAHLHFEVRIDGEPVDPLDYLP